MASNDIITVTVEVDTTTGEQKLVQLGRTAEKVGAQTQQATGKMQSGFAGVRTGIESLTPALAAFGVALGSAALVSFLKSAYIDAARTERAFNGLAAQVRALGGSSGAIRQFINGLSEQANVLDDDLIPAYQRLFLVTQDTSASQYLLELATKAANNGIGTIQANAERLALALQTNTARSLREFGILTKDTENKALNAADGIQAVADKLKALPERLDDAQDRLSTLSRSWDQFKDSAAAATEAVLKWVAAQQAAATARNTRVRLYDGRPAITEDVTRLAKQEEDHYAALTRAEGALAVARIAGKVATENRAKAEKDLDLTLGHAIDVGLINRVGAAQIAAAQARGTQIQQIGALSPTALGAAPAVNVNLDALNAQAKAWAELTTEQSRSAQATQLVLQLWAEIGDKGGDIDEKLRQRALDFVNLAKTIDATSQAVTILSGLQNAFATVVGAASHRSLQEQARDRAIYANLQGLIEVAEAYAAFATPGQQAAGVGHSLAAAAFFYAATQARAQGGGGGSVGRGSAARGATEQRGPTTRTNYGSQRTSEIHIHADDTRSWEDALRDERRSKAIVRAANRRARRVMG